MRAVVSTPDGPALREIPDLSPGTGQILIRVRAASLNRADLAMLRGAAHGRVGGMGSPLGLEWAGEVVGIGPEVADRQIGDRVMGASGGAFAEYTLAASPLISAIPANLSFEEAATLPVALRTMHDAIRTNGMLRAGQSVLIQGASSGVGLMGMQMAKLLGAGLVIGSSSTAERRARLAEFGADLAVDTGSRDWVDIVREATGDKGVDLLIDQVAGPLMNGNLRATRIGGRIVNVGRLGGMRGEFDFDLHALRRITYIGVTFRTRSAAEVAEIVAAAAEDLDAALAGNALRLPIDSIYPLEEAPAALEHMAKNGHFGKIVLKHNG